MSSTILEKIGLGNFDPGYYIIGLVVIIVVLMTLLIIQMVKLTKLNNKYQKFMQGKNAKTLESDIMALYQENKFIKVAVEKNQKDISGIYKKIQSSFQKIGLIKYDAFSHMGGKLSYSLALLDENNNGFILNSVHNVEGCYSYTKEIVAGKSAAVLGDEEKQALDCAMK